MIGIVNMYCQYCILYKSIISKIVYMIGICLAILPSNMTTSTLSFSWSTPLTTEEKHFRKKKECSNCQVRRRKSNVAVGLHL